VNGVPMSPQDPVADVAARIKQADNEAFDAAAAFAAGRFEEYWKLQADRTMKRLEEAGEHAIANSGSGGEGG